MTTIEDRLAEALRARADQVTAERLTRTGPHGEAVPSGRRGVLPALAAGVAAALVVTVVVVAGQDGDPDRRPTDRPAVTDSSDPPSPSTASPVARLPRLLPEDDDREVGAGGTVSFPDGSLGELTGATFTLRFEGSERTVEVPDHAGAAGSVFQTSLRFGPGLPRQPGAITGYLVSHTSGDFTALDVVLDTGEGLVVASPNLNSVPFGISEPLYTTWTSGNGAGLYTRVRVGAQNRFEVYRWEPATHRGSVILRPRSLGVVCFDFDGATYERC